MCGIVFVATRMEAERALAKKAYGYEEVSKSPFEIWQNASRVVVVTGIGLVNASMAFAWAVRNFDFESAFNIGAAGATVAGGTDGCVSARVGEMFAISSVTCMEPYNRSRIDIGDSGIPLVTSSRPVISRADRVSAGKYAPLVDMEGYALAKGASIFSKKLYMLKCVSDFSPECDIVGNIKALAESMAAAKNVWI